MLIHSTFTGYIYEHLGFVPITLTEHFQLPKNLFAYHRDSLIRPVVLGQEAASVTFGIPLLHLLKYLKCVISCHYLAQHISRNYSLGR
jgi:hypothetical protein